MLKLKQAKEEIKNKVKNSKTKKFVVKHKREIISVSAYFAICSLIGYALGRGLNSMINRKIKVELDLRNVAYNTASSNIVGEQKAYEICMAAKDISKQLDKNLAGIKYKDLELMMKRGMLPSASLEELSKIVK